MIQIPGCIYYLKIVELTFTTQLAATCYHLNQLTTALIFHFRQTHFAADPPPYWVFPLKFLFDSEFLFWRVLIESPKEG